MTRSNRSPSGGSTIVNTLRPYEGGTGQTTAPAALVAMDVVALSSVNQPNGVAGLDANSKLPTSSLPIDKMSVVSVEGSTTVAKSSIQTYKINNFDIFSTYTLQSLAGAAVSRSDDTITFTAPNAIGNSGFTINGRLITIDVVALKPLAPTVASTDAGGSTNMAVLQSTGSTFTMNFGTGVHASSDWQISTDPAFGTIVQSSLADTVNKTTWRSGDLALSTTYYVRVRYNDSNGGVGDWSNAVSVTTKSSYVISSEEAKIVSSDIAATDNFGYSVSISTDGSRAVVGAQLADPSSLSSAGAVYIFLRNGTTWSQEFKLTASDKATNDKLGCSVSINSDGTRVVAGAAGKNTNGGVAYVFLRTGTSWTQEAKLSFAVGSTDLFGTSVAISSDASRIIVGAPGAGVAGQAYSYSRSGVTWTKEFDFVPGISGSFFGWSVAINTDGSRAVVGAYGIGGGGDGSAFVYLRTNTSWAQESQLTASVVVGNSRFGWSVSISVDGLRVIVGAYNVGTGRAYIFVRNTTTNAWTQEALLTPNNGLSSDNFGNSVAINFDGTKVIIGAPGRTSATGTIYIFSRLNSVWTQDSNLNASDALTGARFGWSVAMTNDGTRVLTGAYTAVSGASTSGAVYAYR